MITNLQNLKVPNMQAHFVCAVPSLKINRVNSKDLTVIITVDITYIKMLFIRIQN